VTTVQAPDTEIGTQLLDAIRRRDYVGIASCFADDAHMRAVVPPGVREDDGPDAIAARFRLWTGELTDYELVDAAVDPVADLLRIRYAIRGVDPEVGPCILDQTAYVEVAGGRISQMRLACSGDRPLTDPQPGR
jgi:hypothetical protein